MKLLGADVNITGQQKTGHLLMGEGKKNNIKYRLP